MKLGVLNHNYSIETFSTGFQNAFINLGDYVQSYGVIKAYKFVKRTNKDLNLDINLIEKEDVANYSGEPMIVTLNTVYAHGGRECSKQWFPISPDIIPLFIGFCCHDVGLIEKNVSYLKKYSPIGCRDEMTKNILSSFKIEGYISGCSSLLFPARKHVPTQVKNFFVDIPESLEYYIPSYLRNESEYCSHIVPLNKYMDEKDYKKNNNHMWNIGETLLKKYYDEATLVVTSKLHCAVPCLAMGIPTILAKENIDYRFSWLDKLIPLYSREEFENINWNPTPIYLDDLKNQFLNLYNKMILHLMGRREIPLMEQKMIHDYFEKRNKVKYNSEIIKTVEQIVKNFNIRKILIWGAGRTGGLFYNIICNNFPQLEVMGFIDGFKTGNYMGKKIYPSTLLPELSKGDFYDFIFLCSLPGNKKAIKEIRLLGRKMKDRYCEILFESSILVN